MRLHPTLVGPPPALPRPRAAGNLGAIREALVTPAGAVPADLPEEALLVTTGQQAGLFTGPLYTVYKALSAAALARVLEARWHRPVRALFWVPGDDHDYEEVASAAWVDAAGQPHLVRLPPRPAAADMRPVWREPLGPGIEPVVEEFLAALPESPHRPGVAAWIRSHYRPGATVAGAYAAAMAELLAPFGVACLDSTHVTVKRAAAPLFLRAARDAGTIERILVEAAGRYQARGEAPPVEVGDGATLLFLDDRHGRDRLVRDGTTLRTRRGRDAITQEDLERIARDEPTRLSANVLLRPVLESALLPTVAYVAGPGELRYLGMLPELYRALGVHRQLPVPRWSGAIIEPHVERILAKFGATVEEAMHGFVDLEHRVLRSHLPPVVPETLAELQAAVDRLYGRLEAPLAAVDPTLAGPLASSHRQSVWAARDLERKALSRLRAREQVELAQLARLRGSLRPGGVPQERRLTIAPFLARHGEALLQAVHDAALAWYDGALEGAAPAP